MIIENYLTLNNMKKQLIFLIIFISFYSHSIGQGIFINQYSENRLDLKNKANSNVIRGDFNKDGSSDFGYATSHGDLSFVRLITRRDNSFKTICLSPYFKDIISWIEYDTEDNVIYISLEKGEFYAYHPDNKELSLLFDIGQIKQFRYFKFNNEKRFVIFSYNYIRLYDEMGTEIAKIKANGTSDIEIGNVDNDPELEIVVAAFDGYVLSTYDLEIEWQYYASFGSEIELGRNDFEEESLLIYGESFNELTCFDAKLKSPVWYKKFSSNIHDVVYVDSDLEGEDKIILGFDDYISAYNIDSMSLSNEIWTFSLQNRNPKGLCYQLNEVGNHDLFFACGANYSNSQTVHVKEIESNREWVQDIYSGRINISTIDNNLNDFKDILFCSGSSFGGEGNGIIQVISGADSSIILQPQQVKNFSSITETDHFYFKGSDYYLIKSSAKMKVFKDDFSDCFAKYTNYNYILKFVEFVQINNEENPVILAVDALGRIILFNFLEGVFTELWSSPILLSYPYNIKIGNFDTDPALEVAILNKDILLLVDLSSKLVEKQIPINSRYGHSGLDITDYDHNGTMDLIIGGNIEDKTSYQVIDFSTMQSVEYIINESKDNIREIMHVNLDETEEEELILLGDSIYIINPLNGNRLFTLEINDFGTEYPNYDLLVEDFDLDHHMDILIAYENGMFNFNIKSKYKDVLQPFVYNVFPKELVEKKPTNQFLYFYFSEALDTNTLKNNISIVDQNGLNQPFNMVWNNSNHSIFIQPESTWTPNSTLKVTLNKEITDLAGNRLDGNANKVKDEFDDYEYIMLTGSSPDYICPRFDVSYLDTLLQGQVQVVKGILSDEYGSFYSKIDYAEYTLDRKKTPGEGIFLEPLDEKWDAINEEFTLYIHTYNLSIGKHVLYLSAKDAMNNWCVNDSIVFQVIEENPNNWNFFGKDPYNTSYLKNFSMESTNKIRFKIKDSIDKKGLSSAIVVNNYLIYCTNSNIIARDIRTGKLIWNNHYESIHKLSSPAYSYGNIYVQIGDHSNSLLVCLSLTDGHIIWKAGCPVQFPMLTSPIISDGIVIIVEGYYETVISAFDAFSGKNIWKTSISKNNFDGFTPAVYDGKVFALGDNFGVIDLKSGILLKHILKENLPYEWHGWTTEGSPVIDTFNNQVILTNKSNIFALDLNTYELNWEISDIDFGYFKVTPALRNGILYVSTPESLNKIQASSGQLLWSDENRSGIFDPVVSDYIFAFSDEEHMYIFDVFTNELIDSFDSGGNMTLAEDCLVLTNNKNEKITVFNGINTVPVIDVQRENDILNVYPTITSGIINADIGVLSNRKKITISIFNQFQDLVKREQSTLNKFQMDISEFPNGIYYFNIRAQGINTTTKIILMK